MYWMAVLHYESIVTPAKTKTKTKTKTTKNQQPRRLNLKLTWNISLRANSKLAPWRTAHRLRRNKSTAARIRQSCEARSSLCQSWTTTRLPKMMPTTTTTMLIDVVSGQCRCRLFVVDRQATTKNPSLEHRDQPILFFFGIINSRNIIPKR